MRKQGIITHWQKKMLKENPPRRKDKDKDKKDKDKKDQDKRQR
jgi:hypothetical protein